MKYNDYELLDLIYQEDEDAYEIMLKKYEPLIRKYAKKYYEYAKNYGYNCLMDEFITIGYEAFNRSIRRFDDNKEIIFYTYFIVCLKSNYNLALRKIHLKKNMPLLFYKEIDFEIGDSSFDPDLKINERCMEEEFRKYTLNLELIDEAILLLRFNNFKYNEIVQLLEVSNATISRVINKAKDAFR